MKAYPFAYNFGSDGHFVNFYEARKAKHAKASPTAFDPNKDRAYFNTPEAPSPNVEAVDGYLSEEEVEAENQALDVTGGEPTTISETIIEPEEKTEVVENLDSTEEEKVVE